MTVSEKMKTIENTIDPNKAQYNVDKQTVKILPLSSGNVSKYQFLADKDVLPEKDLLQKAATVKKSEYATIGSELYGDGDGP